MSEDTVTSTTPSPTDGRALSRIADDQVVTDFRAADKTALFDALAASGIARSTNFLRSISTSRVSFGARQIRPEPWLARTQRIERHFDLALAEASATGSV